MEGSGGLAVPEGTAQLWLVRHGETEWNAARRLQGHTNEECPLNDRGRRQAEAVASALGDWHRLLGQGGFRKLYCSDLARARSTADAIGAATGLTPDPAFSQGLRERCMGAHLEGLHIHEAPEAAPDAWRAFREGRPIPGGGESSREMRRRVMTTAAQIAATHPGERVIAVSHGGPIHVLCPDTRAHFGRVGNCTVSVLNVEVDNYFQMAMGSMPGVCGAGKGPHWGFDAHLKEVGVLESAFGGGREGG